MYISAIELENFRGFKKADASFNKDLNIFIGENASGKTSLLRAILKMFSLIIYPSAFPKRDEDIISFNSDDINRESVEGTVEMRIYFPAVRIIHDFFKYLGEKNSSDKYVLSKTSKSQEEASRIKKIVLKSSHLPIVKFFPANRGSLIYNEKYIENRVFDNPNLEAWGNVVQNETAFSNFFNWFFENETKELRLQRDSNDFSIESPVLKPIRTALNKTFKILQNKDYLVKSDQITREGSNKLIPTLVIENKSDKKDREILDNKSDGEKAIITLIADIAYNLAIANGGSDDFMNGNGVVMIDEIEAHLHPAWQRKIVGLLHDLFPNIQFFITTHSPQVIASVNSDKVFLCDNFKINKINLSTKGADTNSLLKYVFNATDRPLEFVKLIEAFNKAMEENKEEEALQKIIDQIKSKKEEDHGQDIDLLVDELGTQLEAYKFDREHEMDK